LSIDKFFIFLAKPHKPAFRRQGAKDLLRLVYLSLKMEKVGFLCGLAPLRDKKIVKELPKAGGK
jgi:hypothetical protein